MAFNIGKILSTVNTGVSKVNAVSSAVSSLSSINSQLSNISKINSSSVNSLLSGSAAGNLLTSGISKVTGASFGLDSLNSLGSNLLGSNLKFGEELKGLAVTPIRIVSRSSAELFLATGGRFEALRQQIETLKTDSAFENFIDNSTTQPWDSSNNARRTSIINNAGNSPSRIPNPLRNHNTNNYIITLGILSAKEFNNPEGLRTTGFTNYLIKSGGGDYGTRYRNAGEGNENAEYFIEDLEFDAVIAPNPNTNVSLGTSLSFTVNEPFSMGNFIEAIIGASATAGFKNYLDAPFCLRIDFVGWDEYGHTDINYLAQPIFMPLKFTKIDFNVSGKGSVYAVQAVPMSETGLGDDINKVPVDINANGSLVHEVLETNERSITGVMNRRIESLEKVGALSPFDRYVIAFPKNNNALLDYIKSGAIDEVKLTSTVAEIIESNKGTGIDPRLAAAAAKKTAEARKIVITPKAKLYAKLKTFSETPELMNELGLSVLIENSSDSKNEAQASQSAAKVANSDGTPSDRTDRASKTMAPAEKSADYQFGQGETITTIIEKVMLQSKFCRDNASRESKNGMKKWFKIDTHVFISEDVSGEETMGRAPRVYVYAIMPYETDEARHLAPNQTPTNTKGLKSSAAKEYNYIYTGKNEDVLSFDISFNNAFTQNAFSNLGQNTGGAASGTGGAATAAGANASTTGAKTGGLFSAPSNEPTGAIAEKNKMIQSAASRSSDIKTSIAETFHHNLVNSTIDLCTAEMEIMGDPFFIPQQTGNYSGLKGSHPNSNTDGTMRYNESEVFVNVNFKTPFDYQISGSTMEWPQTVPQFSGLFSVWAVTNNFSGGKFTQRLKMIRRRGQTNEPTKSRAGVVQADSSSALNKKVPSGQPAGRPNLPKITPAAVSGVNNPFGDVGASIANAAGVFKNDIFGDVSNTVNSFAGNLSTTFGGLSTNLSFDALTDAASAFNGINSSVGGVLGAAANQSDALQAAIPGVESLIGQATALQGQLPALSSIGGNLGNVMGALGGISEKIPGGLKGAVNKISSAAAALSNITSAGVFPKVPAAPPDMTSLLRNSMPSIPNGVAKISPANLPPAPPTTTYGNSPYGEFGDLPTPAIVANQTALSNAGTTASTTTTSGGRTTTFTAPVSSLTPANTAIATSPNGTPLGVTVAEYNAMSGREQSYLRKNTTGTIANNRRFKNLNQVSQITGNDRVVSVTNNITRKGPQ